MVLKCVRVRRTRVTPYHGGEAFNLEDHLHVPGKHIAEKCLRIPFIKSLQFLLLRNLVTFDTLSIIDLLLYLKLLYSCIDVTCICYRAVFVGSGGSDYKIKEVNFFVKNIKRGQKKLRRSI